MLPPNIMGYYHIWKAVEGAWVVNGNRPLAGTRHLQGLCLLGKEVCSEAREKSHCQQQKPSLLLFRMKQKWHLSRPLFFWTWFEWTLSDKDAFVTLQRVRYTKSQKRQFESYVVAQKSGTEREIRHRTWNGKEIPTSISSCAPSPPELGFCNCKMGLLERWVNAYKSKRKCLINIEPFFKFLFV